MGMETYGEIKLGIGEWWIRCEPFVSSRLKRVFPRAPQQAAEWLRLRATPENTRELEWFLQRYPMTVDKPERMAALAQEHRDIETRLGQLLGGHTPPPTIELAIPPREYQVFAAQMLDVRAGYLLADDLGLGKTVSAIAGMVRPGNLPALVVCPAHLPRQWRAMIARFAPHLRTHILRKGSVYPLTPERGSRQGDLLPDSLPDVIITSYHKLRGWAETLAGQVSFVVFDECQALRSRSTAIYAAAHLVARRAEKRLGLSATPIYNYGNEFWNVVDVLSEGALGEYDEFIREWCTGLPNGRARINDTAQFGAYLRREGIMLRRTRAEVGRELPELTKIVHDIDADQQELDNLKGNAVALAKIVLANAESYRGQKMQAAAEFDAMMRQATGIAKAPYVSQFVRMLLESGEPIVLFGWHRAVYDLWREQLADCNPVLYTGTESATQKAQAIADFVEGRSQLLIMSLRSGAGVDGLQGHCHTAVFGELDWSPGVHEQCVGRLHRDGQSDPCTAYFLVADSGSDPIVAEVLGVKREQIEGVRNPGEALVERVNTGEADIRRLARAFLERRGEVVGAEPAVAHLAPASNPHGEGAGAAHP